MYKVKFTNRKMSDDVSFFQSSQDFLSYRKTNFIDTEKLLSVEVSLNENVQTILLTFKDKQSHIDFVTDEMVEKNRNQILKYNNQNNITRTVEIIEE